MCIFAAWSPARATCRPGSPEVAIAVVAAIRDACPGIIVNQTTGVVGADISGPLECLDAVRPEIAALNAGSLNYLKTRADGTWAWPPMLFDNPVDKIRKFLGAMRAKGSSRSSSVSTLGIVRTAAAIARNCGYDRAAEIQLRHGRRIGHAGRPRAAADPDRGFIAPGARWSVTAIGRKEIWPLHRRAAELGGDLRTGLEDTIYLPDGSRAASNGDLVSALVADRPRSRTRHRLARRGARRASICRSDPKEAQP